jgi:hypothetical protein
MNNNNKNLSGLVNINADNIYASSTIENTNAAYFTGITSNIQTQIDNISGTNISTLQTEIDTLNTEVLALSTSEAADALAITANTTAITTIQGEISTIGTSIGTIDTNIEALQTKTQLQTGSTTATTFTNAIKVNNGVSNKVILNDSDGYNYFNNKTIFENDIKMVSGTTITTNATSLGQFNLGDSSNVGLVQILSNKNTGTITLSGNTINLNANYVNINGLIFSVNALYNTTGNYFSQF